MDIVVVTFLATLANANDWEDIKEFADSKYQWLKSFLQLTGGIPSAITYERIFAIIKPVELENIINSFISELIKIFTSEREILSVDGKVDRGSSRNKTMYQGKIKALNVLNVYSHNKGYCLTSEIIDDKTN